MLTRPVIHVAIIAVLAFSGSGCAGLHLLFGPPDPSDVFDQAASIIEKNYIDKSGQTLTLDRSMNPDISSLVAQLDSSASHISAADAARDTSSKGAIGIYVVLKDGAFEILKTYPASPARKAGLKNGDRLLEINARTLKGSTISDVFQMLRGAPHSKVTVKVVKRSGEEMVLTLTREVIKWTPTVSEKLVEKDLGYLRIELFAAETPAEVKAALKRLFKKKIKGLVLDLRNNYGGILTSVTDVAQLFLPDGKTIVTIKAGNRKEAKSFMSSGKSLYSGLPLAILIDANTEAGGEILAGALKDNKRAILVGEPSRGKCSIRTAFTLVDRSLLVIRTALAVRPTQELIDEQPIKPDREVVAPKGEQDKIYQAMESASNADFGNSSIDIQLKTALEIVSGNSK